MPAGRPFFGNFSGSSLVFKWKIEGDPNLRKIHARHAAAKESIFRTAGQGARGLVTSSAHVAMRAKRQIEPVSQLAGPRWLLFFVAPKKDALNSGVPKGFCGLRAQSELRLRLACLLSALPRQAETGKWLTITLILNRLPLSQ